MKALKILLTGAPLFASVLFIQAMSGCSEQPAKKTEPAATPAASPTATSTPVPVPEPDPKPTTTGTADVVAGPYPLDSSPELAAEIYQLQVQIVVAETTEGFWKGVEAKGGEAAMTRLEPHRDKIDAALRGYIGDLSPKRQQLLMQQVGSLDETQQREVDEITEDLKAEVFCVVRLAMADAAAK